MNRWPTALLGELAAEVPYACIGGPFGSELTTKDYVTSPGVPVIRGSNLSENGFVDDGFVYVSERKARALRANHAYRGDILFTQRGTIGQLAIIPREARHERYVLSQSQMKLTPNVSRINPRFLLHYFQSSAALSFLTQNTLATGVPHINLSILRRAPVPLPPLHEQDRIAEILDKADALRAKRRTALAQIDALAQSIFVEMFGDLQRNPRNWRIRTIGELCEVKGGKRLPKGEAYASTPTAFRYIRVTDLNAGRIDESKLVYLNPGVQAKISRYIVRAGDVVITIAGTIGLVAPVRPSLDGANLTENAAKLVSRTPGNYDAEYLSTLLRSRYAQSQIASHVGQVTIGKLALFRIEKLLVPLPPLELQHEFVRRANAVRKLAASAERASFDLDRLFASLQHRAFRGEL